MIPPVVIPALFGLAGQALSENAERRVWTGALARRAQRANMRTGMKTGKLVKQNPLPPGRYWIDVFPDGIPAWVGWSGGNLATVSVEKTEFYKGTSKIREALGWIYPWVPGTDPVIPDRAWIIFNVSSPTLWDENVSSAIGWPNTAPKNVNTSDDTVQKPEPKGLFDGLSPGVKIALGGTTLLAAAVLAGYAVRSFR